MFRLVIVAVLMVAVLGTGAMAVREALADAGDRVPLTRGEVVEQEDGTFLFSDGAELTAREVAAADRKARQAERDQAATDLEAALAEIARSPSAQPDIRRLENAVLLLAAR